MSLLPPVITVNITAGGVSQLLIAAADPDTPRQSILIQPQTEACLIQFGQTAGLQATGTLTFADNPADTETIVINGITFTFVTGASTATNVHIGAAKEDTAINLAAVLTASVNAAIVKATYSVASNVVTITFINGGTTGNAYTLADSSSSNVTRSGSVLAGGSNTVGGLALTLNQLAQLYAQNFPQLRGNIYVVSATSNAKIGVTYGQA